jgi:hypothetical protein
MNGIHHKPQQGHSTFKCRRDGKISPYATVARPSWQEQVNAQANSRKEHLQIWHADAEPAPAEPTPATAVDAVYKCDPFLVQGIGPGS